MPKVKVEKIIKADKDKVFFTITDFENLPSKLPQIFKSIKIISRKDNSVITEELVRMAGRDITQKVKHVLQPTDKHEVFILEGDAKGSHIVETYEETSEGTKIIVEGDFTLAGKLNLLGFLAKLKIEKSINEVMDEFAEILNENNQK
ncbi:MAG: SRPBCC family protein [Thaumarchaeota archaeon]|nr:SRPBCC family protein [Nitrososphaerota archaeon]